MQFESGCKINVTKEQEGDETSIVLTGDEGARQKAEEMINELTVDKSYNNTKIVEHAPTYSSELEIVDWKKLSEESVRIILKFAYCCLSF